MKRYRFWVVEWLFFLLLILGFIPGNQGVNSQGVPEGKTTRGALWASSEVSSRTFHETIDNQEAVGPASLQENLQDLSPEKDQEEAVLEEEIAISVEEYEGSCDIPTEPCHELPCQEDACPAVPAVVSAGSLPCDEGPSADVVCGFLDEENCEVECIIQCTALCRMYIEPVLAKINYSGSSLLTPGSEQEISKWEWPSYLPTYALGMRAGIYFREGLLLQAQCQGYLTYWKQPQNFPVDSKQMTGWSAAWGRHMDLSLAYQVPLSKRIEMKPYAGIRYMESVQDWSFDEGKLRAMQSFEGWGPLCGLELQKAFGCWGISTFARIAGGMLSGSWAWAVSGIDYNPFSSVRPFLELGGGASISSSSDWGVWGLSLQKERTIYLYTHAAAFASKSSSSWSLMQEAVSSGMGDILRSTSCTFFVGF